MNVKNIKSFVDFYKSLEISTCIAPFPRSLKKKYPEEPILKKLELPTTHNNNKYKDEK